MRPPQASPTDQAVSSLTPNARLRTRPSCIAAIASSITAPISHDYPDEALEKAPLGPRSAIVFLSHDPKIDDPGLSAALKSDCFYIGTLGSKKTQAARVARMKAAGFDDAALARIHGPVGLNIGAKSPSEIAVSILAEMTLVLRGERR